MPFHALVVLGDGQVGVQFQRPSLVVAGAVELLEELFALFLYGRYGAHEVFFGHVALIKTFVLKRGALESCFARFLGAFQLGARVRVDFGLHEPSAPVGFGELLTCLIAYPAGGIHLKRTQELKARPVSLA